MSEAAPTSRFPTFARLGTVLSRWEQRFSSSERTRTIGGRIAGFFVKRPGWIFHLVFGGFCLAALYWWSVPGGNGIPSFLIISTGLEVLCIVWLIRLVGAIAIQRRSFFERRALIWAVTPILVFGTAISILFGLPLRTRFELSRNEMDRFARDVMADRSVEKPSYLGLYPVGRFRQTESGMQFLVRGAEFLDEYGFAYSPNGPPVRRFENNYVHIDGPWYIWEKSW